MEENTNTRASCHCKGGRFSNYIVSRTIAAAATTTKSNHTPSPHSPIDVPLLTNYDEPSLWEVFLSAARDYVDNSSCYTFLILVALALIILGATMLLGVFYTNQPLTSIVSLSLSSLNITATNQLSGKWQIGFSVQNRLETEFSYDFAEVKVYYRDELIAEDILGAFHAKGKGDTMLKADVTAENRSVSKYLAMDVLKVLGEEEEGVMVFDVKLRARESGKKRKYSVNTCKYVGVRFWKHGVEGALLGDSSPCWLIYIIE